MRSAFTLIELLVVIAILALLAAILIPVIQGVLHNARVTDSTTRMRNLAQAIQIYSVDNGMRFPGEGYNATQRWLHQVVPYMGIEPDGMQDGVPYFSGAYSLFDLVSCPVLHGEPIQGKGGTYLARYGLNRLLLGDDEGMTGLRMVSVKEPARTVMLGTKASGTPALHYGPYPAHPWGLAGNFERGRSPEAGMEGDGYLGSHAYVFCDGHLEIREHFIGQAAFEPDQANPIAP